MARTKVSKEGKRSKKATKSKTESIYKKEDGWYYFDKYMDHEVGPFRTRELARIDKKVPVEKAVGELKEVVADLAEEIVEEVVEEKKKAYKFVSVDTIAGEIVRSSARVSKDSSLCLFYKEGEVTDALPDLVEIGFGICCFETIASARAWGFICSYSELWEVEIGKVVTPATRRLSIKELSRIAHKNGFSGRQLKDIVLQHPTRGYWPYGMVMTDRVKLVRKLERADIYG